MRKLQNFIQKFLPTSQQSNITQHVEKQQAPTNTVKHHYVAGVAHYKENIISIATENPNYKLTKSEIVKKNLCEEMIYQYCFPSYKTQLIPDLSNQYDSNAIKVLINDKHVGYIKAGSCKHILNLINENKIKKIETTIKGGKYKMVYFDEEEEKYLIENDQSEYRIKLSIFEQ